MSTIIFGKKVSPEFKRELIRVAGVIGTTPDNLMACLAFESGETFRPDVRNAAGSSAVGLIQFMPDTAKFLGTSTEALAAMTAEAQLAYVEKYFLPYAGRLAELDDLYMAILWPRAIGKGPAYPLFIRPSRAYEQNAALDADRDGVVTKAEAAAAVRRALVRGEKYRG